MIWRLLCRASASDLARPVLLQLDQQELEGLWQVVGEGESR